MRQIETRITVASVALGLLTVLLTGCSSNSSHQEAESSGAHMSRVTLYEDIPDLAQDSAEVVVVTVADQSSVADIDPITDFTLSVVTVCDVVQSSKGLEPGASIIVRQVGSARQAAPAPLLEKGKEYLLFLTPSGLDGALADQYYVTGADAGLYVAASPAKNSRSANLESIYLQVQGHDGERLPDSLTVSEITN